MLMARIVFLKLGWPSSSSPRTNKNELAFYYGSATSLVVEPKRYARLPPPQPAVYSLGVNKLFDGYIDAAALATTGILLSNGYSWVGALTKDGRCTRTLSVVQMT